MQMMRVWLWQFHGDVLPILSYTFVLAGEQIMRGDVQKKKSVRPYRDSNVDSDYYGTVAKREEKPACDWHLP